MSCIIIIFIPSLYLGRTSTLAIIAIRCPPFMHSCAYPTVPSAGVVDLTGVNTSSTSLLISWGPPPGPDRNGIIRAYNISYRLTSQDDSVYSDRVTNETMIELQSLEKFRRYTVVVRPYTIGAGPETSVIVRTDSDCKLPLSKAISLHTIMPIAVRYL